MPTGYTADIADGKDVSFEQFVWTCTRAMGATVLMRDEPHDRLPPERFEASTYYQERIDKIKVELARLNSLTQDQVAKAACADYEAELVRVRQYNAESAAKYQRYQDMIDRVTAWKPPTPDHVGLRDFMLQQLTDSQKWDCGQIDEPRPISGWRGVRVAEQLRDLAYHEKELSAEIARTEARNKWLADLRASVPLPTP